MTLIFYYRASQRTMITSGRAKLTPPAKILTARVGDVRLSAEGVFVDGWKVDECALFHGNPPRLLSETITLEKIRKSKVADMLPTTYIDETGSVKEGATGKVIFKA